MSIWALLKLAFSHDNFVDAVLESSCTGVYTPVLRAPSPRSQTKILIFRGTHEINRTKFYR